MIFLSTSDEEVRSVKVQKQIPGIMEHKCEAGIVVYLCGADTPYEFTPGNVIH